MAGRGADVAYVEAAEAQRLIGAGVYVGAFVDRRAGCLQPLSYARELARAAMAAGARIHRESRVVSLDRRGAADGEDDSGSARRRPRKSSSAPTPIRTGCFPNCLARSSAATSLQIATEPLPEALRDTILPVGEALSDTRKVIRYWRLDAAGRLLMGGRGPYREPGPERDWAHLAREVSALYPALQGIGLCQSNLRSCADAAARPDPSGH